MKSEVVTRVTPLIQPLTDGPAREIVIRMMTRWSRTMAAI